jgi:hypothetical protein
MNEWHYAIDGETVGPVSADEVARRLRESNNRPLMVWRTGMSGWVDARSTPEFAPRPQKPKPAAAPAQRERPIDKPALAVLAQRARHEAIAYFSISAYLLVWFSAVMFYKSTILGSLGIAFAPFGLAAVKALILGKFILVLEALKVGERGPGGGVLAIQILKKALLFTLLLIFLTVLEEVLVGVFHGRAAREALTEIAGGSLPQAVALGALMFLVLVPYLAFRRLAATFGELPELLFARNAPKGPA